MTGINALPPDFPADSLRLSIGDMIINSLDRDLERPVVVFDDTGRVISAQEYRNIISQYAQAMESLGVKDNIRFGVLSRNRPEILFANGAISFLNTTRVGMHPLGSIDDFEYIMNDANVEALIIDPDHFQDTAAELQKRVPQLKLILSLGPTEVGVDISALAQEFEPNNPVSVYKDPEAIAGISYSGGTTGQPKAICSTSRNIGWMLNIMLSEWEWPENNVHLVCAPLSHGGGAMVLPTILKGGSIVVLPGFNPEQVLASIEKHKIRSLWLVPAMIYALLDNPNFDQYDLSSVEIIYYGASSISPTRLKEAIEKFGPVFFQFYGQAEAPMTVTVMRRSEHDVTDLNRLASCGRPVFGVRCKLLDDDCNEVPDGEPGEICIQGPLIMGGYLNKPEVTAEALKGGWLHSGDVAVKDPDGFFRIVDRKKDMIVSGGFNVFPREVEDVLTSHPAVAAAAVFGLPDEKWGEKVTGAVVLHNGMDVAADDLKALVKEKKGSVQTPKEIFFIDAVPLSQVGKPDKKALRARFGSTP